MVASQRNRSRYGPTPTGEFRDYNYNGTLYKPVAYRTKEAWNQQTVDVIGNPDGTNPFVSSRFTNHYQPVTAKAYFYNSSRIGYAMDNWPCSADKSPVHLVVEDVPPFEGATLTSRMSPNKPLVDLPVMFAELKDLPGMVRHAKHLGQNLPDAIRLIKTAGESIITRKRVTGAANTYLAYTFGWDPLISDLATLFGFADAFSRRRKQLGNLWGRGLRRRITLGTWSKEIADSNTVYFEQYNPFAIFGKTRTTTTVQKWATSKWYSTTAVPPTDSDKDFAAVRSLLGIGLSPAALWELVPWSFLADYFLPIGDFLETYRNTIPCFPSAVCEMTRTKTTVQRIEVDSAGGFGHHRVGGGGSATLETKQRIPKTVTPIPSSLPFLGAGQMSNIAALSVSKRSAWR